jgi:hypothetical protein
MNWKQVAPPFVAAAFLFAGAPAMAGPQGVVDDYETAGLSEYTLFKVLDQGDVSTNISFVESGGALNAVSTGTTGAEQVLFFRNDGFTLEAGEELQVDGPPTDSGNGTEDFGLAVGQTPTSLGNPEAGNTRALADFLFISYRNVTQLNSRGFNGNAEVGQVQTFGINADVLFIARLANDDMELGYYDGVTRNVVRTVTPATTDIYSNIGYYADLRADGATLAGLDNLRIVPEPASLTLIGIGGALAMTRRRG